VEEPKFLISDGGIVIFSVAGETHSVGPGHEYHKRILEAVKADRWVEILPLVPELPKKMKVHIGIYMDHFDLGGAL
jgi:hypothetical protein